jgi:hypothetical protein
MFADFETFEESVEEQRGPKTNVLGKMSGVASCGYCSASQVPAIPCRAALEHKGADEFVLQLLRLALQDCHACRNPVHLMQPEDDTDFNLATACYMCKQRPPENQKLVKDHNHFTSA